MSRLRSLTARITRQTPLFLTIFGAGVFLSTLYAHSVLAELMESSSYQIQFGNFNMTSGEKSSASYTVTDTVGQMGAGPYGQYGSSGYFLGGGFQYIYQVSVFDFRLSKTTIDLGMLDIGVHSTDSHTLTISTSTNHGYTVYAYEDHPLKLKGGSATIPDTTCDAGTCLITAASIWTNQAISGFGYNMTGDDIPVDFASSSYFRPFADRSLSEPMQAVMSSPIRVTNRVATITYKAGIDATNTAGNYSTGVAFVAVPNY